MPNFLNIKLGTSYSYLKACETTEIFEAQQASSAKCPELDQNEVLSKPLQV